VGAIIMVHGDDQGLIFPPRLAPHQIVIVPIFKSDEEKAKVFENAQQLRRQLVDAGVRVKMDEREGLSPGFKFNDWEMRGIPLRLELGPKDVAKGSVVLARRDRPGKDGKAFVPQQGIDVAVAQTLETIQKSLYERAVEFRKANTAEPTDYEEFKKAVEKGFAYPWWCGGSECEEKIKDETKATMRCIPLDQTLQGTVSAQGGSGTCIYCGQAAKARAIFARAY
jgi:prolyl-tRNA synthetase